MAFAMKHLRWGEHRGGMFVEVDGERSDGTPLGFPNAGSSVAVTVRFEREDGVEKWTRTFSGRSFSFETVEDSRFCFHVEIGHRVCGLIVRYQGWLQTATRPSPQQPVKRRYSPPSTHSSR